MGEILRAETLFFCIMLFTSFIIGGDTYDDYVYKEDYEDYEMPKLITPPQTIHVNIGDTIRLSCEVDKLNDILIFWRKGGKVLAIGDTLFKLDDRIKVEQNRNGSELTIRQAVEDDGGEYSCQIA